jgi:hypothetical protein
MEITKEKMARSSREEPPKTSAYKGWEKLLIKKSFNKQVESKYKIMYKFFTHEQ